MYDMISLHYLCELLHEEDEDKVLQWVKQHNIATSKWVTQWQIDTYGLLSALRFSAEKKHDEYLGEELKVREESISDILLHYDDMLLQLQKNVKMLPVIHFIFKQMASLVSNDQKRKIFLEVSHGASCSEVAHRNNMNWSDASNLYDSAFKEIKRKTLRLSDYRHELAQKELEIKRLKEENFALKHKAKLQETPIDYEDVMEFDNEEDRLVDLETLRVRKLLDTLSMSCYDSRLNLSFRVTNIFRCVDLDTVEDVLKSIKADGFDKLLKFHRFGKKSLKEVKDRFRALGIIDEQDRCKLFDYVECE